jgi:hypothetical protein
MNLRPGWAAGSDETKAMNLPRSATASPQSPSNAAQPPSTPAVVHGARENIVGTRSTGKSQPARPTPKKSRDSELRKGIWILLAVLVLILAVIAAGVVWWKVIVTGAPSPHSTVGESSIPVGSPPIPRLGLTFLEDG